MWEESKKRNGIKNSEVTLYEEYAYLFELFLDFERANEKWSAHGVFHEPEIRVNVVLGEDPVLEIRHTASVVNRRRCHRRRKGLAAARSEASETRDSHRRESPCDPRTTLPTPTLPFQLPTVSDNDAPQSCVRRHDRRRRRHTRRCWRRRKFTNRFAPTTLRERKLVL